MCERKFRERYILPDELSQKVISHGTLGYDSSLARRFMALAGHACASLSTSIPQDSGLKTFILYASNHPILNDSIYYGSGGMHEQLTGNITK